MYNYIYRNLITLFKMYLFGLLIFFISRLSMIYSFSSWSELFSSGDIISAFVMGFRVDSQVLMYGLSLPLLLILVSPLMLYFKVAADSLDRVIRWSYIFSFIVLGLTLLGNYFFYEQFNENFNQLVFAFFNDDTKAILSVIWLTYPVIKIFISLLIVIYILNSVVKKVSEKNYVFGYGTSFKVIFIVIFLSVFFFLMRGSFGMFPLGKRDLIVSDKTIVNDIATNGVLSLKQAISDGYLNEYSIDINKSLHEQGFNNVNEAITAYLGGNQDSISSISLMSNTKKDSFLEGKKYNVVFIVMESMNNNYIDLNSNKMNLLGSLAGELDSLIVFRNFLPKGPRTIHSLDGLIVNNIQRAPLSQTIYSNMTLDLSNIKPFKDKGYHTVFTYGGQLGWRNLKDFYKHQYFDNIYGDIDIIKKEKGATAGLWGVYDEYLFNYIYESLLSNKDSKPIMNLVMTTSNHTPYTLPENYRPYTMELSDSIKRVMIKDEEIVKKHLLTYQYANDQLGKFISRIRNSNLRNNTVVIVTGDHTNTEMFNYDDANFFKEMSVPLMMYIPEELKKKLKIDTSVYGSHKDIFPTLFNLVLSDAQYVNSGDNLFDVDENRSYGVSNNGYVISKDGAVRIGTNSRYYEWGDGKIMNYTEDSTVVNKLKKVERKAKGYKASMIYLMQKEIRRHLDEK